MMALSYQDEEDRDDRDDTEQDAGVGQSVPSVGPGVGALLVERSVHLLVEVEMSIAG